MIPDSIQREIKEAANIADVVGEFVDLKKSGSGYKGLCPFHSERTPSFHITPARNIFKCFGCGKGGDPIGFLMEHERMTYIEALTWLDDFYKISIDCHHVSDTQRPPRQKAQKAPPPPPSFTDPETFQESLSNYGQNNLVQWLCQKLNTSVVMDAVNAYHIGTAENGGTIFWQVNIEGKAGGGKIIRYPSNDHHRIQNIKPNWMHKFLGLEGFNLKQHFFGEHLLAAYPEKKVCIVESEKTALICNIYFESEGFLWLASCGKDGLINRDKWRVLHGREVVLYPDLSPPDAEGRTAFLDWSDVAAEMQNHGIDARVNTFLEDNADECERAQKWDLADFLLVRDLSAFQLVEDAHNAPKSPTNDFPNESSAQAGRTITTPFTRALLLTDMDGLIESFDRVTAAWIGVIEAKTTRECVESIRSYVAYINQHLTAMEAQIVSAPIGFVCQASEKAAKATL